MSVSVGPACCLPQDALHVKVLTFQLLMLLVSASVLKKLGPMFLDIFTDGKLVTLYLSFVTNVYESATWPKLFPDYFGTEEWDKILDELRSLENWYGMSAKLLLYYITLWCQMPIILPFPL